MEKERDIGYDKEFGERGGQWRRGGEWEREGEVI